MIKTRTMNEICDEVFSKESRENQAAARSGIEMLDNNICIFNGNFILVSAPFSSGKTALLLAYMNEALCDGKRVDLFLFNEMNFEVIMRLVASEKGMPTETIYENQDKFPNWAKEVFSQDKYKNLRIIEGSYTDEEIIEFIEKGENRDLLLIDNMEFILDSSIFGKAATYDDIEKRLADVQGEEEAHAIMNTRNDRIVIDPENRYLAEFVMKVKELGKVKDFAAIGTIKHSVLPKYRSPHHKPKIEDLRKYGNLGDAVDAVLFPCVCSDSYSYFSRDVEDFDDEKAAIYISDRETLTSNMLLAVWDSELVRFMNYKFEFDENSDIPDSFFEIDEEIHF